MMVSFNIFSDNIYNFVNIDKFHQIWERWRLSLILMEASVIFVAELPIIVWRMLLKLLQISSKHLSFSR